MSQFLAFLGLPVLLLVAACTSPPVALTPDMAYVQPCGSTVAVPQGPDGCGLVCRAELPLRMSDNVPLVTLWINGAPATMILDTGAEATSLTPPAASRLGLVVDSAHGRHFFGIGGTETGSSVGKLHLAFGNVSFEKGRLDIVPMKGQAEPGAPDGLLGVDILARYELDLDLPHGKATLYRGRTCAGMLPGWKAPYATIPFAPNRRPSLVSVPVQLEGRPLVAVVDTGAELSVVTAGTAMRTGLEEAALRHELGSRLRGVGPQEPLTRLHRFKDLQVADEHTPAFDLAILPTDRAPADVLLGEDYLRTHKLWISFATKQMHITNTW